MERDRMQSASSARLPSRARCGKHGAVSRRYSRSRRPPANRIASPSASKDAGCSREMSVTLPAAVAEPANMAASIAPAAARFSARKITNSSVTSSRV